MKKRLVLGALCVSFLLVACDNQQGGALPSSQKSPVVAEKEAPPAAVKDPSPAEAAKMAAPHAANTVSGKVLETMNAGGYTYLQVDTGSRQQWVAIPETTVKTGDAVTYYDGMVMPNFTSKSLNRTFDSVIFSNGLVGKEGSVNPHGMGGGNAGMNPPAGKPETGDRATADSSPAEAAKMAAPHAANTVSGKVLETMNAGGYTYLQVDTGSRQQWVAIPETTVKTGDAVTYYDGMVMPNFTSKSLNRTFDSVIFSNGLVGKEGSVNPHGMGGGNAGMNPPAGKPETGAQATADSFAGAVKAEGQAAGHGSPLTANGQGKMESGGSLGAMAPFADVKVAKAAGENGYAVEDVFAQGSALDGKVIRVRGKAVKFSPNIMGKNWIHLQDGTGDPMQNSHDLVVTTSAQPADGQEVVLIEGTVRANKDFGAGYKYVVIVEDATIIQE